MTASDIQSCIEARALQTGEDEEKLLKLFYGSCRLKDCKSEIEF